MVWSRFSTPCRASRTARRPIIPEFEALEVRTVLSTISASDPILEMLSNQARGVHASQNLQTPMIGTITGMVSNTANNRGLGNVKVQLINASGRVVQTDVTGPRGRYRFDIRENGPYVVHEVVPRGFAQANPTFATTAPQGSLIPGAGNNSWNYATGDSDPTKGPVGPASWSSIAPAGNEPFESPININVPATDLSQVLGIHYANKVPSMLVNNGHQIQVQFPGTSADSVTVSGQQFNLAQFHYHDPSETTVNNHAFSMEEHFVNTSASGAETVLAVFLQLGAHNDALDPILQAALAHLTKPNSSTTTTDAIDFAGLLPASMQGWFYQGSLTTPSLSLPVNWFVFATPITLDSQQLSEYEQVASGSGFLPNARPVQPLDGRRLNEIDYDVNFQGQSIAGLNFSDGRLVATNQKSDAARGGTSAKRATTGGSLKQGQGLPLINNGNPALIKAAQAQNLTPLAGCNCPICQILRNADLKLVTLPNPPATVTAANVGSAAKTPIV